MTLSPELVAYKAVNFQLGIPIDSPIVDFLNEWFIRFKNYLNYIHNFFLENHKKIRFILRMWASGTVSYMMREHFPVATKCRTDSPPETYIRTLTLTDLAAAFLILGIGLSLSILAFAIEILSRCVVNRVQTVKKTPNHQHHVVLLDWLQESCIEKAYYQDAMKVQHCHLSMR